MNSITLYLEKFKGILSSGSALRRIVAESVKEVTGRSINEEDILVRDQTATLRVSPAFRSMLFLSREKITERVKREANKTITVR